MTVHINHVVAQVPFVVETHSFCYMKEKALGARLPTLRLVAKGLKALAIRRSVFR